jgi:hypothetical protein
MRSPTRSWAWPVSPTRAHRRHSRGGIELSPGPWSPNPCRKKPLIVWITTIPPLAQTSFKAEMQILLPPAHRHSASTRESPRAIILAQRRSPSSATAGNHANVPSKGRCVCAARYLGDFNGARRRLRNSQAHRPRRSRCMCASCLPAPTCNLFVTRSCEPKADLADSPIRALRVGRMLWADDSTRATSILFPTGRSALSNRTVRGFPAMVERLTYPTLGSF